MSSDGPVVSVVTPVYNGERYLEDCIRSVLSQTFREWEYVIYDNLSSDGTSRIAQEFASADPRITVRTASKFREIYGNHNAALRAIDPRSRYCKIVHADDWLYPECLERMVSLADEHPSVGVVSAFRLYGDRVDLDGIVPTSQSIVPGQDVVRRAMLGRAWRTWVTGSPTSLLLRADLLRGPGKFYDETFWHADTEAAFRALMRSDLGFVHQVLTYTRSHAEALTSFTDRVNSYKPQEGRLLLRFGPRVLNRREYRRRLRRWFGAYGWYLVRQAAKPGRLHDTEFREFHRAEIDQMLTDARDDVEARAMLSMFRLIVL